MRTFLPSLPLAMIAALCLALPAAGHLSPNVEETSPSGEIAPGIPCDIAPHLLYPLSYAPSGVFFHIVKADVMEDVTSMVGGGFSTYAVHEDTEFVLKTNYEEFWTQVEPLIKSKIAEDSTWKALVARGIAQGAPKVTITKKRVRWTLVEYDVDENLQVSAKGNARVVKDDDGSFDLKVLFGTPTDPLPSIGIEAKHMFEWTIESADGKVKFGNKEEFLPDLCRFIVLDKSSPSTIGFSPNTIFGTTGDSIVKFNEHRDRRGITLIPANPPDLLMFVADNARYAFAGGQGVYHKRANLQALVYVETYITSVTDQKPARQVFPIESTIQEYFNGNEPPPAYPAGMGKFVWVGPIDLRKDLGIEPQTTMNAVAGAGQNSETINIHVWKIPIADLETKLHARLGAQYANELKDQLRPTFLDHHFAGACYFEFPEKAWGENHSIDDLEYFSIDAGKMNLGGFEFLRLSAAVSDAAGNWSLPEASDAFVDWDTKNDIPEGGDAKARTMAYHRYMMPVVVFDNDKPNPMLIVTAQGRNGETRTTRYTIPNGDLAHKEREQSGAAGQIGPWINDDREWVFDWKGESPTMQWLKDNDKKRFDEFKESLEILENTRVVFEVAAYDNVNKIVRRDSDELFTKWGVCTPVTLPKDATDPQLERPVTWRIFDPTVPDESMLYEDPADKMFVYPDHIYRKVDTAKMEPSADGKSGYGVEVMVNDRSNFNEASKNGGSQTNWRKITLWFNVIPSAGTGIDRMGNEETVGAPGKEEKK